MLAAFQVLTLVLVAVAVTMTLAHALELPGKLRLSREAYLQVQPIYYPGFTIGGAVGEFGGIVALAILALIAPSGPVFWLTLGALAAMLIMHALYWVLTHPVNSFWLKDVKPQGAGGRFFGFDPLGRASGTGGDWEKLRDRWEYSHVARAVLAVLGFVLLASAVAY
jgi:hypothetical protein